MPSKFLALAAVSLGATLGLVGCAAAEQPTLDYLKGSWACSGGPAGSVTPKPFTATFDGATLTFAADEEWEQGYLPLPPDFKVGEQDGLVTLDDGVNPFVLDLPAMKPEDGTPIIASTGTAGSGVSNETHYTATFDGSKFTLALEKISGTRLWDLGECVKQ